MTKNRNDINIIERLSTLLTGIGAAVLVFAVFCAGFIAFAEGLEDIDTSVKLYIKELPQAYCNKVTAGTAVTKDDLNGLKYTLGETDYTVNSSDITNFALKDNSGSCEATLPGNKKITLQVSGATANTNTYNEVDLLVTEGNVGRFSSNFIRVPKSGYKLVEDGQFVYALKDSDKTAWIVYYESEVPIYPEDDPEETSGNAGSGTETSGNAGGEETSGNAGSTPSEERVFPDITIDGPITIGGKNYDIVGIDDCAFVYSGINSFTGPNTLETIGKLAFSGCAVKTVDLSASDNKLDIGHGAFLGCHDLETVLLPDTLRTIGNEAFRSCDSLEEIEVPPFVNTISGEITFPEGAKVIGAPDSAAQKYCAAHPENHYTFTPNDREVIDVPVTYKGTGAELFVYDASDALYFDPILIPPIVGSSSCCYLDPEAFEEGETYKLVVTKPGYTEFTVTGLRKDKSDIPEDKIKIYPGNLPVNGKEPDGKVQLDDIAELSRVYGQSSNDSNYLEEADFNSDGIIDMNDVVLLINSGAYNKKSDTYNIG